MYIPYLAKPLRPEARGICIHTYMHTTVESVGVLRSGTVGEYVCVVLGLSPHLCIYVVMRGEESGAAAWVPRYIVWYGMVRYVLYVHVHVHVHVMY